MYECLAVMNFRYQVMGSAFFVRISGRTWLATTTHNFTGDKSFSDRSRWPDRIRLESGPSSAFELPVNNAGSQNASMRFFTSDHDGTLYDFLLCEVPVDVFKVAPKIYELDVRSPVEQVGSRVSAFGFPKRKSFTEDVWPPSRMKFTIREALSNQLNGDKPSVPGYSGGPVVGKNGQLVGMTLGFSGGNSNLFSAEFFRIAATAV